ncbi:unnamed protein product [Parnassius apollo]|uniref:Serine/threonine-protein kinase ATM n=1 Tax=Parnassius apollo TaxID=110799 RepID=A0A8S3XFE9_PARAO|nr:unnamed protein product [Parnassius apollo]
MSLEISIKQICETLKSNKVSERKKSAEKLKDFLTRNAVPDMLSDNSRKKVGFTWNDLFDDVNEYILKETEKFESSKNFSTTTYPLCTSILHLCVAGSNKGKTYIKCEKIMEACLIVLRDKRLTNAVGDAYLSLLYKYVLCSENYSNYITPSTWDDLLDVCITSSFSNVSKLDDYMKLKLLWLVIKNAGECCQFAFSMRNHLSKISKYFQKVSNNKKVLDIIIDLMITILEMLYFESRLSMCNFAENNLPLIFQFYEQTLDVKKKSQLFKLFYISITIHHTQGQIQNEESALASNWDAWNKCLQNIMDIICLETTYIQKSQKQNQHTVQGCPFFYQVAACSYFLMFKMSKQETETDAIEKFAKKPRITINKSKNFNDLLQEFQKNHIAWVGILQIYVKLFGSSISTDDYQILMQILEELVNNINLIQNWDVFESLVCLVLNKITSHDGGNSHKHNELITSFWNSCVRNSTSVTAAQKSIHGVMQTILSLNILLYKNVKPLLILYFEKGMPVFDSSVQTLNMVFQKFFTKCCHNIERIKCFTWLVNGRITNIDVFRVKDLFLTLLSNENVGHYHQSENSEHNDFYNILYKSIDKSILYSDFALDVAKVKPKDKSILETFEINDEVNENLSKYLQGKLSEYSLGLQKKDAEILECVRILNVCIVYFDILLKYRIVNQEEIKSTKLFSTFEFVLKTVYTMSVKTLKNNILIRDKNILLQNLQSMFAGEYDSLLNTELRLNVNEDFFHCLNGIINSDIPTDDDDDSDMDMSFNALKHNCVYFLAVYSKKQSNFRDELLELILNPKLYNFCCQWDIESAFKCIKLLIQSDVEDPPIELIFGIMQSMCKDLFRNSKATLGIIQILLQIIDKVWLHNDNMRHNCLIMVKSYLHRCENLFYPPEVAALIYECAAKIILLNNKEKLIDIKFKDILIEKIKGNIYSIRLYCSYLITEISEAFSDEEIESYLTNLKDIFTVVVPDDKEIILKDELKNRTATLLHSYSGLALYKHSWACHVVKEIVCLLQLKTLDKHLVNKVLNIITTKITQKGIDVYLDQHILLILQCWLEKKYLLEDLPTYLFGCENFNLFLTKYMKWLVSVDILWRHLGNVQNSTMLTKLRENHTEEFILEKSFCNIIILSLPYIVNEKYNLNSNRELNCKASLDAAYRMFQQTRQILKNEKWSNLFVENMGQLVLLTALHLRDYMDAQNVFAVKVPRNIEAYGYSKDIFCAILKYFGELIDANIMEYLCENQPLAILKVLFMLWDNVLSENVFGFKVISMHTFITFVENVPLDFPLDAILCNFVCLSISRVIKKTCSEEELSVYSKALLVVMMRFNTHKVKALHKTTLSEIMSILLIKKGDNPECEKVFKFIVKNFKDFDKDIENLYADMVEVDIETCFTEIKFLETLQKYEYILAYASLTTLSKIRKFLKVHKKYITNAYNKMTKKGFSEDCKNSIIHKTILAISNILKNLTDDKMKVEASNCLAEVVTYDLKTLVTVPPNDTKIIINIKPTQYFAITVVKSLFEIIFDEDPTVSDKATKALYLLLKFKDGSLIEIADSAFDQQIIKCLTPPMCESFAEFTVCNASMQWMPINNEDHFQWIKRITASLVDTLASPSNYLTSLCTLCHTKPSICERILPSLVGLLLEHSSEEQIQIVGQQINQVFSYIWGRSFNDSAMNSEDSTISKISNILDHDHKMIVHYLLDIVNTIRLQRNHLKIRKFRHADALRNMRLEYDKLAWAATLVDQNIAAIYYGELWAVSQNDDVPPSSPEATAHLDGGENVQKILRKCFVSIGEIDAVDGCGTAHLTSEEEKRKHLLHTGQYADALLLHDIALSCGNQVDNRLQYGVVISLHKSGMHHLALQYIKSFPENNDLNDVKFDCLSYLGDWSEIVDIKELEEKTKQPDWNPDTIIKSYRYACLKECLNAQPNSDFEARLGQSLNGAKLASSNLCQVLNMENCQNVYKVVANLHLLRDIEDYSSVRCGQSSIHELLNEWKVEKLPSFKDFRHLETLLSQRSLILEYAAKHYESFLPDIIDLKLQYVDTGLSNQRVQMAQRLLETVKKLQTTDKVALVESQIAWAKGHKDIALSLLHDIVTDDSLDVKLAAVSLRQYGLWMAECRRENARDIISKYLEKSLEVLNKKDHTDTRFKVYLDIAKFADAEYKQVVAYMNSTVFENKVKCIENMKGTAASLKVSQQSLTKDERRALLTNDRFRELDEAEVVNTRAEKETFLNLAMRYYLLSLKHCEKTRLSIFRVISLWLDNPSFEFEDKSETNLQDLLNTIPSWKFITVLPQLAPRLTTDETDFAEYLRKILERCAVEHPHHTLPILFNLKNSDKDNCILNASKGKGSSSGRSLVKPEARVAAADALVRELAQRDDLNRIISQMEQICDAIISFAYFVPKVNSMKPQPIPSAEPISKLRNLDSLPIPTVTVPIKKDGVYSNLATLTAFENYFELVGGINYPKKVICRSSDGKGRILLIKGEDDLRQDAVMQQVFNIVNTLLEKNPITNKNKLLIRTYKVVPMSRRSGVLEWCEGTIPLGAYLLDAHTRYRPQDITPAAARTKLKACHESRKLNKEKVRVFMEILANFKPVFHNFFTEHYHDPITWYERRLAYTRSVATSSMVGHILGLGDRHVQNILIDKKTAEVVHIDFGIAFDQGKALPTPETIPFRLTQDIIAGFGCCGVEGIFRRCCEKTMQLLRDNQETLLTILEVLLYDPLYSWTVNGTLRKSNVHSVRGSELTGAGAGAGRGVGAGGARAACGAQQAVRRGGRRGGRRVGGRPGGAPAARRH